MSAHRVARPAWRCAIDGTDWPCAPAKQQLIEGCDDPAAVVTLLCALMSRAADDLGVADPTDLYDRFVAWTISPTEACRACGRLRHAAAAGLPPRLVPCDQLRNVNRPSATDNG